MAKSRGYEARHESEFPFFYPLMTKVISNLLLALCHTAWLFQGRHPILGFHSRDQQPCFSTKTREDVNTIIASNSRRIGSGHQHGRLSLFGDTNIAAVTSCEIQELVSWCENGSRGHEDKR